MIDERDLDDMDSVAAEEVEQEQVEMETNKVNTVVGFIRTRIISDTNILITAVATYVEQKVGLKVNQNRADRKIE